MNMGRRRRASLAVVAAGAAVAAACASAAPGVLLTLVRGPGQAEAGRPAAIVVRATETAKVRVWIVRGRAGRSFAARSLSRGRYRARVVFPSAGRWAFGAQAGGARARLGSVQVLRRAVPLTFTWPTSVDVEPDGSLLLVENGGQTSQGRVVRIDPATGKTGVVARVDEAYAVAHAPSGAVYLSAGKSLLRLDGAGGTTPVARAAGDIGPVAVAASGDVYYTAQTQAFRVPGGTGTPVQVAAGLSGPHGLAVTSDGGLLVSDTGNGRVRRVDLKTGAVETWGDLVEPRGISIAPDGQTAYVVDKSTNRVVHLRIDGKRLGSVRHVFADPYAVATAPGGSLYVVDTAATGRLYRVGPSGAATAVSRR
jgi:DNA-binding beta-propeller fold protein YncE